MALTMPLAIITRAAKSRAAEDGLDFSNTQISISIYNQPTPLTTRHESRLRRRCSGDPQPHQRKRPTCTSTPAETALVATSNVIIVRALILSTLPFQHPTFASFSCRQLPKAAAHRFRFRIDSNTHHYASQYGSPRPIISPTLKFPARGADVRRCRGVRGSGVFGYCRGMRMGGARGMVKDMH